MLNAKDQLVFSVAYNNTWYNSIDKDDGGWSLEMIDPYFPCKGTGKLDCFHGGFRRHSGQTECCF
ncbi:MAG: hypothetical protein U5K79_17365 [Cyclobacteriaceae bacterium]|nr:hypothetical protein [Cyclobacteriaceae bacterium]